MNDAGMVELADTRDLKSLDRKGRAGSSPAPGIKINNFTDDEIIDLYHKSESKIQFMRMLGYKSESSFNKVVKPKLVALGVKDPKWDSIYSRRVSDQQIIEYASQANSITSLMNMIGLKPNGYAHNRFKQRCKKLGIIYKNGSWCKGQKRQTKPVSSLLKMSDKNISSHKLKLKLIKEGIIENKCNECGIILWNDKPISLHLDHIDGNRKNNELSNLRLLCPNCHSQTETYARIKNIQLLKFNNDIDLFNKQYNQLKKSAIKLGNHIYCIDIIEFYHQHMWHMSVDGKQNPVSYWNENKDKIIENRIKYCYKLNPRDIRRFFKIMNMVPTIFPDQLARYLSNLYPCNVVIDPFAGFSGRMLGATSLDKHYIGCDQNVKTADGSARMSNLLNLNAEIHTGNSEDFKIEGDVLITSPPYYNKDNYGFLYESVDQFNDIMTKIFSNWIAKVYLIDFKSVNGYSIEDFKKMLPLKIIKEVPLNFGGLFKKSTHTLLICKN